MIGCGSHGEFQLRTGRAPVAAYTSLMVSSAVFAQSEIKDNAEVHLDSIDLNAKATAKDANSTAGVGGVILEKSTVKDSAYVHVYSNNENSEATAEHGGDANIGGVSAKNSTIAGNAKVKVDSENQNSQALASGSNAAASIGGVTMK